MKSKKKNNPVFEIIVVLAIVAIVAVTGLVLVKFESKSASLSGISLDGSGMTGFVVSEPEADASFTDIAISEITVNPPSPIIADPFEVRITLKNEGAEDITVPFYVRAEFIPNLEGVEPIALDTIMTKSIKKGESAAVVFNVAAVTNEGPFKIIATADSTAKLDDMNSANNQMSKTIIITNS
ncbi:MAG: CARDB domain-containing protein [archaeon]